MRQSPLSFTVPEAGFVLGASSKVVNKAIDDGEIIATRTPAGTSKRSVKSSANKAKARVQVKQQKAKARAPVMREIGPVELRYLAARNALAVLSLAGRRKVYAEMRRAPDAKAVRLGPLAVELSEIDQAIAPRVSRVLELRQAVETKSGVVVLRDTEVPVYAIAALNEYSIEAIGRAYPSLSTAQIQTARDYAKIHPKAGPAYSATTMKDRLANLARVGAFDSPVDIDPPTAEELRRAFE